MPTPPCVYTYESLLYFPKPAPPRSQSSASASAPRRHADSLAPEPPVPWFPQPPFASRLISAATTFLGLRWIARRHWWPQLIASASQWVARWLWFFWEARKRKPVPAALYAQWASSRPGAPFWHARCTAFPGPPKPLCPFTLLALPVDTGCRGVDY